MASRPPGKRSKVPASSPPWLHKHAPRAYVARITSPGEIWRVVQGGAGREATIAWVAERQLGLITNPQLHSVGLRRGAIEWRIAAGALHPRHRGVYLVGHSIPLPGANELAAVLAVGEHAFVSHRSAAALWGLAPAPSADAVRVTVVRRNCRSREGLLVHRVDKLAPADRADKHGIPATAPARTLIDYASVAGAAESERAIAEAFALKLLTQRELIAAIDRAPYRAGVARVRAILGQPGGPSRTRSGGEQAMLRLIRAAHIPPPRTNYPVAGYSADFCWPDERLIVELDGYDFHSNRAAIERDHRRDIAHKQAGYEVLRFTGQQLKEDPVYVATVIARALDRRSRTRG